MSSGLIYVCSVVFAYPFAYPTPNAEGHKLFVWEWGDFPLPVFVGREGGGGVGGVSMQGYRDKRPAINHNDCTK